MTNDAATNAAASVEPAGRVPSATDADLRRFGITAHELTIYEWNGYRYSNAADAIAAAKRGAS